MKNKKIKTLIFILLGLVVIFLGFLLFPKELEQHFVSFENKEFKVEIADTQESREKGLMYRESMDENKGMIFVFQTSSIYTFWMKNTLIPLDMIWINEIDGEKRVADIQTAQPCVTDECEIYAPSSESIYVLEINAGLAEKYDIKIGDILYID